MESAVFQRILVPLDESKYAEQALTHAEEMVKQSGGHLSLVVVVSPPPAQADNDPIHHVQAERPHRAQVYLQQQADALRSRGVTAVSTEVLVGDVADCITDAATSQRADLIAMSTHGLGNTGRYALGSVALKVLMTAPCPVLMVRIQKAWDPAEHHVE